MPKKATRRRRTPALVVPAIDIPTEATIVHVTEFGAFRRCRVAWSLSREGLYAIRRKPSMWLGTGIHTALAAYYRGQMEGQAADPVETFTIWHTTQIDRLTAEYENLWDDDLANLMKLAELGEGILRHYLDWSHALDKAWRVLAVEAKFARQLPVGADDHDPSKVFLVGTADLVVESGDGHAWVVDHKTSENLIDLRFLELEQQTTAYMWLLQPILGDRLAGSVYNSIRRRLPRVPELTSKGALSRRSIITTYSVYLQAIHDYGLKTKDYDEELGSLKAQTNPFFTRERVSRNEIELAALQTHMSMQGIEIRDDPDIYPNQSAMTCPTCEYAQLCKALLDGSDVADIQQRLYTHDPERRSRDRAESDDS